MLGGLIKKKHLFVLNSFRKYGTEIKSSERSWDIYAGILVERLPVITKALNSTEQKFQTLLLEQEFEGSLKSDFEIKHEQDIKQAELIRRGELEIDLDDSASKQTAEDLKDAYSEEFNKFNSTYNIKTDEKAGSKLSEILYLLIEQNISGKKVYTIPQGKKIENETMRQTAERVLKEKCGSNINTMFYGNAPSACFKFKYPASLGQQTIGRKVFLYRTCLKLDEDNNQANKNYDWKTKQELLKTIEGTYMENLQKILF